MPDRMGTTIESLSQHDAAPSASLACRAARAACMSSILLAVSCTQSRGHDGHQSSLSRTPFFCLTLVHRRRRRRRWLAELQLTLQVASWAWQSSASCLLRVSAAPAVRSGPGQHWARAVEMLGRGASRRPAGRSHGIMPDTRQGNAPLATSPLAVATSAIRCWWNVLKRSMPAATTCTPFSAAKGEPQ